MRRLGLVLAIASTTAAGCAAAPGDDTAGDPTEATARPRIQVADPILRGGSFEEGHVAFVASDDVPEWAAPVAYGQLAEATVDPGSYELTVEVVPCDGSCPARPVRSSPELRGEPISCSSGVDLERGDVAVFEPIVELADGVSVCLLDGRTVSSRVG